MKKPHPLLMEIENDDSLSSQERDCMANFLRKRIKKQAHRPPKPPRERNEVAITVLRYESEHRGKSGNRCKREAAVAEAQSIHGISRETVFRDLKGRSSRPVGYRCIEFAGILTVEMQMPDHRWRRVPTDWHVEDVWTF